MQSPYKVPKKSNVLISLSTRQVSLSDQWLPRFQSFSPTIRKIVFLLMLGQSRPVWPDWAKKSHKSCPKIWLLLGLFSETSLLRKQCSDFVMTTFGGIWLLFILTFGHIAQDLIYIIWSLILSMPSEWRMDVPTNMVGSNFQKEMVFQLHSCNLSLIVSALFEPKIVLQNAHFISRWMLLRLVQTTAILLQPATIALQ